MRKLFLIARSNMRKAKGQTVAIVALILLAAMLLPTLCASPPDICAGNFFCVSSEISTAAKSSFALATSAFLSLFTKSPAQRTLSITQKKFPAQISGGEAQRVGIVRALINNPEILFADEPTGALNSKTGLDVLDTLTKFNERGQSVVMVTHDMRSARRGNPRPSCDRSETALSPKNILPRLGVSIPESAYKRVDLPAPLAPIGKGLKVTVAVTLSSNI